MLLRWSRSILLVCFAKASAFLEGFKLVLWWFVCCNLFNYLVNYPVVF